jgi:hypothetical protein
MRRSLDRWLAILLGIALTSSPSPVRAFLPPMDQAGPLVMRIDGPGEVTQIDTPVPVRVLIENRGDTPVQGTVELKMIDRWTASSAGLLSFALAGQATESREFTVQAGKGAYEAHYPIHAYARFVHEGKPLIAHPILIVQMKLDDSPGTPRTPPEWKPYAITRTGELAVWQLPTRRAVVQVFGEAARTMPPGWHGTEAATGASVEVRPQAVGPDRRTVLAIHPPWRGGQVGTALAEFPIVLPETRPITLRFASAVTADGQGDGVTFRVRALPFDAPDGEPGAVVFERHSAARAQGEPGVADLGRYAGQAIRLQLASRPGPKNNTGWDQSYWIEPTLVVGTPAAPAPFPPKDATGSIALEEAVHAGVPFDGIGIQAHEPRTERFPLDRVRAILDHYATLGKDLHITEFTPTSAGAPMTGTHQGGVWDEAAQADYVVKFYRVAFAHPAVRAITWWDLSDRHSWLPGGGLLRADMSPKPAYEQLKHLIS